MYTEKDADLASAAKYILQTTNTVIAVRIYYGLNCTPMADLRMSDGVVETIRWTDIKERKKFIPLITGYTLIYDERPKRDWEEWL